MVMSWIFCKRKNIEAETAYSGEGVQVGKRESGGTLEVKYLSDPLFNTCTVHRSDFD